jgi:hypothetical protein
MKTAHFKIHRQQRLWEDLAFWGPDSNDVLRFKLINVNLRSKCLHVVVKFPKIRLNLFSNGFPV